MKNAQDYLYDQYGGNLNCRRIPSDFRGQDRIIRIFTSEFRIIDAPKGTLARQLRRLKGRTVGQMTRVRHVIQRTNKRTSRRKTNV